MTRLVLSTCVDRSVASFLFGTAVCTVVSFRLCHHEDPPDGNVDYLPHELRPVRVGDRRLHQSHDPANSRLTPTPRAIIRLQGRAKTKARTTRRLQLLPRASVGSRWKVWGVRACAKTRVVTPAAGDFAIRKPERLPHFAIRKQRGCLESSLGPKRVHGVAFDYAEPVE